MIEIPTLQIADIELPPGMERLRDLAYDLWWSWTPAATRLFTWIEPDHWRRYHNPVEMLINVEPHQWQRLLADPEFRRTYDAVVESFDTYRSRTRWFTENGHALPGPIAYFSMEFGLHESLGVYSGGLGILSGDHCKAASDLGVPLIAVGLLYQHGYFRQTVDADGFQQHIYPNYDFARLPVLPVQAPTGGVLTVPVDLPGRVVHAAVWKAQVGRVPVLMLDTDIPLNDPADRPITGMLYVRGREMRLCQEIVLGVGGVRALRALDVNPAVWHMNEGHVAFLGLERARDLVRRGEGLPEALKTVARALGEEGPLSGKELKERVERADGPVVGQSFIHLMFLAAIESILVRGPMRGKQHAYALVVTQRIGADAAGPGQFSGAQGCQRRRGLRSAFHLPNLVSSPESFQGQAIFKGRCRGASALRKAPSWLRPCLRAGTRRRSRWGG